MVHAGLIAKSKSPFFAPKELRPVFFEVQRGKGIGAFSLVFRPGVASIRRDFVPFFSNWVTCPAPRKILVPRVTERVGWYGSPHAAVDVTTGHP